MLQAGPNLAEGGSENYAVQATCMGGRAACLPSAAPALKPTLRMTILSIKDGCVNQCKPSLTMLALGTNITLALWTWLMQLACFDLAVQAITWYSSQLILVG